MEVFEDEVEVYTVVIWLCGILRGYECRGQSLFAVHIIGIVLSGLVLSLRTCIRLIPPIQMDWASLTRAMCVVTGIRWFGRTSFRCGVTPGYRSGILRTVMERQYLEELIYSMFTRLSIGLLP